MMAIQFLGATGTVTGSKYLVHAAGKQILVDCPAGRVGSDQRNALIRGSKSAISGRRRDLDVRYWGQY